MRLNQSILIGSAFIFSLISSVGIGRAAQSDNAACNVTAQKVTDGRLKVLTQPKSKADLETIVKIIATVNTGAFSRDWNSIWGELRLCIQDPKTNNWSQKKASWSLTPPQQNYTYAWNTGQTGPSPANSNPGKHAIKIIAINNSFIPFLAAKNLYAETSITLETKEISVLPTPPVPPVPDGGVDPDSGSGEPPPPGSAGPTPPGSDSDEGEQPSNGGDGGSTSPLFGAQAVRDYFAGLAQPQSIPELVIKIINFLLGMIAFAAFIAIIIGGIQYMTSLGNEEKAATAKRTIVYAVVGVIISMSLITIISVISEGLKKFF